MDELQKEYNKTLIEIAKLESQIIKLRHRVIDLEIKMMDAEKETTPHLDKDGCVYWDHLIKNGLRNGGN